MPFADNAGLVTRIAQHRRQRAPPRLDAERRVAIQNRVALRLLPPGVFAGQQRIARRRASRGRRVPLGEAGTLRRQPVNVGRLDFCGASTAHVTRAKIVGENNDDVRLGLRLRSRSDR